MNALRKFAVAAGMTGAAIVGAAAGVTMISPAGAQTSTSTPAASSQTAPSSSSGSAGAPAGPHQANGKTETALTGDDLAKVTAAVQTAVPNATIDRAETDADGATYEAHITKTDGSKATVKFDASFNVTRVDAGMT